MPSPRLSPPENGAQHVMNAYTRRGVQIESLSSKSTYFVQVRSNSSSQGRYRSHHAHGPGRIAYPNQFKIIRLLHSTEVV